MRKLLAALLLATTAMAGLAANPSPMRLVALGDGPTEGEGDTGERGSYGLGYPGRLQKHFDDSRSGSLLLNVGHSGWTTNQILDGKDNTPSSLKEALDFKPTTACVWVGGADIVSLYHNFDPSPAEEKADVDHFRQNLQTILGRLRQANADVYVTLLDDQSKRPALQKGEVFAGINRSELKLLSEHGKSYNVVIRDEARKNKCTLVDVTQGDLFSSPLTLYDGLNLNGPGYDVVTERWRKALKI